MNMSSQASDEVLALGQYHKQLLAMRTGSGLEGIEVGLKRLKRLSED